MLYQFIRILWNVFDSVFDWFITIYNSLDVNFTSLVLAALAFSSFIGYVISPYIRNPLRSADQERARRYAVESNKNLRRDIAYIRRNSSGGKR